MPSRNPLPSTIFSFLRDRSILVEFRSSSPCCTFPVSACQLFQLQKHGVGDTWPLQPPLASTIFSFLRDRSILACIPRRKTSAHCPCLSLPVRLLSSESSPGGHLASATPPPLASTMFRFLQDSDPIPSPHCPCLSLSRFLSFGCTGTGGSCPIFLRKFQNNMWFVFQAFPMSLSVKIGKTSQNSFQNHALFSNLRGKWASLLFPKRKKSQK